MDSTRQQKVSRLLQKELAAYFLLHGKTLYSSAMISVTKVNVSKDLAVAKVFVSIFGAAQKENILNIIKQHAKDIRRNVGEKTRHQLRVIPEMEFFIDDTLDFIERIDNLLKK